MNRLPPAYLSALGLVNALGNSREEVRARLLAGDGSGMVRESGWLTSGEEALVGKVRGELPKLPEHLARYDCRNNRLLLAALAQISEPVEQAIDRYGRARVGVVLGTSTSGIAEGEAAIAALDRDGAMPAKFDYASQEIGTAAPFLARHLGLLGPAYTVSTACTSSAKALVSARLLLAAGVCDAVLAGGVDSLCRLTVSGFTALESVSPERCNPMSANRCGINIGEGAALFLLTRETAPIALLGHGETSDAHHISAPHPEGLGAEAAMRVALHDAGLKPADIAYVNLHGTATPKNDEMESRAMRRVFSADTPASSTKPLSGHTLGAAGATEIAFCWLALSDDNARLPPHVWDGVADPALPPLHLVQTGERMRSEKPRVVMSNGYAFGGSNVSLIIGAIC
ncbi:MAG: beta-ketoacyl-[acyl-carrier-protein] synthase family protein [Pseudomonadota bacterium]|nr:beta-ketoacyl-[acyl-carrier-protein] synthase family protein [Pseudomonadota bacterium]